MAKQIGKLERELARKEKALAEAATLLVLRESTAWPDQEDSIDEETNSISAALP